MYANREYRFYATLMFSGARFYGLSSSAGPDRVNVNVNVNTDSKDGKEIGKEVGNQVAEKTSNSFMDIISSFFTRESRQS